MKESQEDQNKYLENLIQYKNYPLNSVWRQMYDYHFIPFNTYINVHFKELTKPNSKIWKNWFTNHIDHIFDEAKILDYQQKIDSIYVPFKVQAHKAIIFYNKQNIPVKLDEDIKKFIAFLCGGVFFDKKKEIGFLEHYTITFSKWLEMSNWDNPKKPSDNIQYSIMELSKTEEGQNYIRKKLSHLPIFDEMSR